MKAPGWYYVPNEPDYVQYFDGERLIPESKRLKDPVPEQKSEATLPAFVTEAPPTSVGLPMPTAPRGGGTAKAQTLAEVEEPEVKSTSKPRAKTDRRAPKPPKVEKGKKLEPNHLTEGHPVYCPRCRSEAYAFAVPGKGEIRLTHAILLTFVVILMAAVFLPLFALFGFFVIVPLAAQLSLGLPALELTLISVALTTFLGVLMLIAASASMKRKFPELLFQCGRCAWKF